ncbi:MAG: FkbM family methyltransferase [Rubrimonas sp.]
MLGKRILMALGDLSFFGFGALRIHLGWILKREDPMTVSLKNIGEIRVRPFDTDFTIFREIFKGLQYAFPAAHSLRIKNRYDAICSEGAVLLIVDAGANVGAAARWFLAEYPKARVIAVEPEDMNAALCSSNIAEFGDRAVLVRGAVGGTTGSALLHFGSKSVGVCTERSSAGATPIYPMADIIARGGPNARLLIVKIDIEGFEDDLFLGDNSWVNEAFSIIIEPHDWKFPGKGSSRSMQRALMGRDFELLVRGDSLFFVRDVSLRDCDERDTPVSAVLAAPVSMERGKPNGY